MHHKIAQRHRAQFHIRGKCIRLALLILTYMDNSHCFDVYWNIPSQTCQQFGIYINASQYGIVQNTDDVFYGDKNVSLFDHLHMFTDEVTKKLPKDFKGNYSYSSSVNISKILQWKGREIHPEALWGYYHYPYCHNYGPQAYRCQPQVVVHNDEMSWLMEASTALYPSIYLFKDSGWDPISRRRNTLVRIKEAIRVRRNIGENIPFLPYFWYR
ncbi:hyaluronidase-like [Palaemon carinicauda]|uniref:hyaluronidase-like n=1 Tax=Palaemon carinicauda TaxID=392227 RepID=UPI0035B658AD